MSAAHRILVVDDNDLLRENLAECLVEEGFHVDVARDGHGALLQLSREPLPHLVLVDMMMPGMSGSELMSRIRSESRLAGVRLVLASGMAPPADLATADAILTKPYGIAELLRTVRPLLERA